MVHTQWDKATPHRERILLKMIAALFKSLGWVLTFQPPNSPLCNMLNLAIFPAVAKDGTSIGNLLHGGWYLQCEKLWQVIKKAWDDYLANSIAWAFIHHFQVAAAIYKCGGKDTFVWEQAGLNFGFRRVCRPFLATQTRMGRREQMG